VVTHLLQDNALKIGVVDGFRIGKPGGSYEREVFCALDSVAPQGANAL
jgi:hypothetical protein